MNNTLTKADAVALWYAVEAYEYTVNAMKTMDYMPEQMESETARLKAAKLALRKVNAIRRAAIPEKV